MTDHPRASCATITSILLEAGVITGEQLEYALVWQRETGRGIEETLVEMDVATEEDIGGALAHQLGLPFVDVRLDGVDRELIRTFPDGLLRRHHAIPLVRDDHSISIALADPTDVNGVEALERAAGSPLSLSVATPSAIRKVLEDVGKGEQRTRQHLPVPERQARYDLEWDRSGATFLVLQISAARKAGASEIHFISELGELHVYHRIGHRLVLESVEPANVVYSLLARLESLGGPTIDGQQIHAVGLVNCPIGKEEVPLEVSLFNGQDGISVTLGFRPKAVRAPGLRDLGLDPVHLAQVRTALSLPAGLIIVSGPPRAGCSTTIASMLAEAEPGARRTITFQKRLGPPIGGSRIVLDASHTRSLWQEIVVAQRADVVALDGILCGDTICESLAPGGAGRLLIVRTDWTNSFGLLDHLVARPEARPTLGSRLQLIVQQRLVQATTADSEKSELGFRPNERVLFEVLVVNEAMRQALRHGAVAERLRTIASADGFRSLADEVGQWVAANILTDGEAARVLS